MKVYYGSSDVHLDTETGRYTTISSPRTVPAGGGLPEHSVDLVVRCRAHGRYELADVWLPVSRSARISPPEEVIMPFYEIYAAARARTPKEYLKTTESFAARLARRVQKYPALFRYTPAETENALLDFYAEVFAEEFEEGLPGAIRVVATASPPPKVAACITLRRPSAYVDSLSFIGAQVIASFATSCWEASLLVRRNHAIILRTIRKNDMVACYLDADEDVSKWARLFLNMLENVDDLLLG